MLSNRERQVLILVVKEYSSAEIAEELNISIGTVFTHRKRLLEKLGVKNSIGLVKYAIRNKLVSL
jgi:DNA-binding CsgD family transcriptional regulator